MAVLDWLTTIKSKRTAVAKGAEQEYLEMREDLANGKPVPPDVIDRKLTAANIEPDRLSDEISIIHEIRGHEQRRAEQQAIHDKLPAINEEHAKLSQELQETTNRLRSRLIQLEQERIETDRSNGISDINRRIDELKRQLERR